MQHQEDESLEAKAVGVLLPLAGLALCVLYN